MNTSTKALLAATSALCCLTGAALADDAKLVQTENSYFKSAQAELARTLALQAVTGQAKNVILFVGDGMSIPTITAARILEGQKRGVDGESNALSFEKLPYAALSKTYSHDGQIADSAPTAAAMMTGVKSNNGTLSILPGVSQGDCAAAAGKSVATMLEMAETIGMATGVVSTARITHATPAATYSHSADRDWESDAVLSADAVKGGCRDIASQLIDFAYGDGIDVVMGGGRSAFLPATMEDPEDAGKKGARKDGRNLTEEWVKKHKDGAFVWNKAQFEAVDAVKTGNVLALFNRSHMEYDADLAKDKGGEPSLAEMTAKTIDILKRNPNGFFLMVEAGRIDHAHHAGNAARALEDTLALHKAVETALSKVDLKDTLIVVTADHSHTFAIQGYSDRGNPILGLSKEGGKLSVDKNGKPYTTLAYTNGPGGVTGERADLTNVDVTDKDFLQQALIAMDSETHAGDDVAIFAAGPWAHLFQGVHEQNYIFHVMNHASKITERLAAKK